MAVIIGLLVAIITVSCVQGACQDLINNCNQYAKSNCQQYPAWGQKNCPKYCGFCMKAPTCTFKGRVHSDGSNWLDGCKARCQCRVGKGKFPIRCNALCWSYDIPSSCTWNKPAPGKCCHTPNCPPGVKVNYPDDYFYWGEDVDMKVIPWN